ncbi:ArsR family transcriptional regulator [Natribaculum luteum]|uniref:ArsR family transcriptional regulator n=1 Tax=Natribaculum luteum TaxID=1586232 RepID=A0ABD5P5C2_9EURY|nr:transcriptional regulator [Natribaculum luteum]
MTHASDRLLELPPSSKLVFKVLEVDGPMTQGAIADATLLNPRTVRDALGRLDDASIVSEDVYFRDARKSIYTVSSPPASE